jgi:endonuclease/exonuclease/phosphatase family metal-dependent hydrolase
VTWNLFHGRDAPPDPALRTWLSRLLRVTERNATHAQVNRVLLTEFAALLAGSEWELALLQEAPPRWLRPLCEAAGAGGASALTSRNFPHLARAVLARLNPDLIASSEGGSNQLLARPPWRVVAAERVTIANRPERRRMLLVRLREQTGRELVVANLHASTGGHPGEVLAAAARADRWARGAPLVFGGDLNVRPEQAPEAFALLERRHGLRGATAPDAIDHLLARGLRVRDAARRLPPQGRELPEASGRVIRLSDHAPVVATYEME